MTEIRSYSRRFVDAHGDPMPAYQIGGYVAEKNRRDWDGRSSGTGGRGFSSGPKEWWEVRRAGDAAVFRPGVSLGRLPLFEADTLRECRAWIAAQA